MEFMQNSKIQGNYLIELDLTNFSQNFTFQGNNRNTILHPVGGTYQPSIKRMNNTKFLNSYVFVKDNVLKIKRGKIVTFGADGLRGGFDVNDVSGDIANIDLILAELNDLSSNYGYITLRFNRYNEWEDFNAELLPDQNAPSKYVFNIDSLSYLSVDDYNIQTAYIGQGFKSKLVLDIDTAGLHPKDSLYPYTVV